MNILVINGSPKGKYSITLQTCLYLEKKFPEANFTYLHAGQKIKSLEKDFSPAAEQLKEADIILFCYPVYTFLVPSQLHRFIELMKAEGLDLSGKTATQVSTSKHFYDITAHKFIEENCRDLGLDFIDGLSADMEDLLTDKGRRQATDWMEFTLWQYEGKQNDLRPTKEKDTTKKAVIVADLLPGDDELQAMIDCFTAIFPYACDIINIEDFPFLGGCISCFNCSTSGKCIYKDGFDDFLRNNIHKHDAIIYAFRIKDHSMGSRFKMYDDRQFCNGHRTVTMGTPFGYLIAGDYDAEPNLRLVLEARAQVGGNFLAGVATVGSGSEPGSAGLSPAADASVTRLSNTLCYALEHRLCPPQNFLGVGGMKIFRDLIYQMRGMMRADHKFFKSHGQYDFPQKRWPTSLKMYLVGWLMSNKKLKSKMGSKLSDGMIAPYKKVLDEA